MTVISPSASFIDQRQQLMDETDDPALKRHYQDEIDLVKSWDRHDIGHNEGVGAGGGGGGGGGKAGAHSGDSGDIRDPEPTPDSFVVKKSDSPHDDASSHEKAEDPTPDVPKPSTSNKSSSAGNKSAPDGYAQDWHTIRYSNTTKEPVTVHVTVAAGQALPKGVDANGDVVIPPGKYADLTFEPETSANFKTTTGDGSVWNQGEVYFDEKNKVIWGNMSYIYGANSNMRMYCQDGQRTGYQGDIFKNAPAEARVGNWGIMAPYDRFHPSDDPNNPGSATGGPDGAKNAGAKHLYDTIPEGDGYVDRGHPAEKSDYDDKSSHRFTGSMAVVI